MNATCKTKKEKMYQELLKDQLRWLNRYGKNLKHKAKELYLKRIQNKLPENMVRRCCDFVVLEEKCREYIKLKRKGQRKFDKKIKIWNFALSFKRLKLKRFFIYVKKEYSKIKNNVKNLQNKIAYGSIKT